MIPRDTSTATDARHAESYSAAVDVLLAYGNADYTPTHCFRGRHAHEYDFYCEEANWAVRCIEAYPLWPHGSHRAPGVAR